MRVLSAQPALSWPVLAVIVAAELLTAAAGLWLS